MRHRLLDWLRQDVGYALRGMRRAPGFTAMVVLTLALGVGANAAMYSVLDGLFGVPAGIANPDGLKRLYLASPENFNSPEGIRASLEVSYQTFSAFEEAVGERATLAAWAEPSEGTISRDDEEQPARISWVTHDYFSVLGIDAFRGRLFAPEEGRVDAPAQVAILSHSFWTRAFDSDPGAIGRTVAVNDTTYTVIGVAGDGFRGLDVARTDVFLPLGTFPGSGQPAFGLAWYQWGSSYLRVVGRFDDALSGAVTERATLGFRSQPEIRGYRFDTTDVVLAGPIVEALGPGRQDAAIPISTRTAGVTLVVLLVACANAASLLLVRASRRRREIAVRLALGVSRKRLFAQLLTEIVLLALIASAVAVAVGAWGGSTLRRLLLPDVTWAQPTVEPRLLVLALGVAVATGLLAALAPGFYSLRTDTQSALKAGAREGSSRRSLARSALLVTQAALSVVLVVGAALFVRSLGRLDAIDLGYEAEQLVRVWIRSSARTTTLFQENPSAVSRAAANLSRLPGVIGSAQAYHYPMGGYSGGAVFFPGELTPVEPGPSANEVSPEFFHVTGLQIVAGRTFEPGEAGVALVNEMMAATLWPGQDAVGQCFARRSPTADCTRVIGVVQNAHLRTIIEEPVLQYFVPLEEGRARAIAIRFNGDWRIIVTSARAELERTFDAELVSVDRMSDGLAPQLRQWRLGAEMFTAFGLLALIVTAVGIYSVTSYTVSQRTHEMGVRIALGARIADVLRLVIAQGIGVILVGIALGITIALALGRLIASLLYEVQPRDPMAMTAAAAVLLAVGVLASLIPALRAARVDPVRALSAE
jgi:putative ABC transport system permease protein